MIKPQRNRNTIKILNTMGPDHIKKITQWSYNLNMSGFGFLFIDLWFVGTQKFFEHIFFSLNIHDVLLFGISADDLYIFCNFIQL